MGDDDDDGPLPEPFKKDESNPYVNMSRLDGPKETNTIKTPDLSPNNSTSECSPSQHSDFKLNFDLDDSISQFPPDSMTHDPSPDVSKDEHHPHQTDNDNAMDASLFKSGTQTQRELDELVWTQTQETSALPSGVDKIKIQSQETEVEQPVENEEKEAEEDEMEEEE